MRKNSSHSLGWRLNFGCPTPIFRTGAGLSLNRWMALRSGQREHIIEEATESTLFRQKIHRVSLNCASMCLAWQELAVKIFRGPIKPAWIAYSSPKCLTLIDIVRRRQERSNSGMTHNLTEEGEDEEKFALDSIHKVMSSWPPVLRVGSYFGPFIKGS